MKKNKLKNLLVIMISFIIFILIDVYATNTLNSNLVSYNNSNNSLTSTNVQGALDELYTNINNCPDGYLCKEIKISPSPGDYIKMTPILTSYTTDNSMTGYISTQTINPSELNLWRVLKVNDDGTIEIISEYVSSEKIYFSGQTGYKNFVGYLNVLASKYENSAYTKGSRYVGYNGQTEYLTDTANTVDSTRTTAPWKSSTGGSTVESQGGGDTLYQNDYDLIQNVLGTRKANQNYWLASRYYHYSPSTYWYYEGRHVDSSGNFVFTSYGYLYSYNESGFNAPDFDYGYSLRPIVILKSGINYTPSVGTIDDPFVLN